MSFWEEYCRTIDQFSDCMNDYLFAYDIKNDYYYISPKAVERFQLETHSFENVIQTFRKYFTGQDTSELSGEVRQIIAGNKDEHDISYPWKTKNGELIWIHCKGKVIKDENGNPEMLLGCVNEIGQRQIADNITGLKQTGDIIAELDAGNYEQGFFMRIGLDGFKNVVERLGMEYGDQVLRGVAGCIAQCLTDKQRVFRAISDEFLVVDFSGSEKEDAVRLYRRIRAAVDHYIEASAYKSVFTVSAGAVTVADLTEQSYDEVMRISRFVLNMAKNHGRNQIYLFDADEYALFLHKRDLTIALRQSVANDFEGFELYFQPIVYADEENLYAAESLCRFFMNGKMVSPVEFIPILEDTGLIIPVGRWIMEQAVSHCKKCRKIIPNFRITINMSYVQILKSAVMDELLRLIDKYQLEPDAIVVELTESGYLESTAAIERIWKRLREAGIRIAIDDFGSGYSNIRYLDRLRPNVIKIDRSFTLEALSHEYAHHLLVSIIHMAHSMGLTVCVEGVETGEELTAIQNTQSDYIQGYYYGKPCTGEQFLEKFVYMNTTA